MLFAAGDDIFDNFEEILSENEEILWIKEKTKAFDTYKNGVFFTYIPPERSIFFKRDSFEKIEKEIIELKSSGYNIILVGDFNSSTKSTPDFVETDSDILAILGVEKEIEDEVSKGLKILSKSKIPIARMSEDSEVNSHGKCLIDICRNSNLFIFNSRLGKDLTIGQATCNDVSVVDLVISAPEIFPIVKEFEVLNFNPFLRGDPFWPVKNWPVILCKLGWTSRVSKFNRLLSFYLF